MPLFSSKSDKTGSISSRIMLAMIALTLLIMVIIAGISYGFMRHLIKQNVIKTLEQSARQSDQKLELTINSISEEMLRLSSNSIMVNALIDTNGSQAYIVPFFRSYKPKGDIAIKITLCDFMGKPIASNVKDPGVYSDPELLKHTISRGMNLAQLATDKGNAKRILLAYPIVWEMTKRPEGVLVAEIGIEELVDKTLPIFKEDNTINFFLSSGSRMVFSKIKAKGKVFFKLAEDLHVTPPLDQLDLKMEIADYEEINFGWLIVVYILTGIFFFSVTIWLSQRMSYFLTAHLRTLRSTTQKISESGDLETRAEIAGPDEVRTLAASFNSMIDKLKESHNLLETRIAERTTELSRVNEQLQKELAERRHAEEQIGSALLEKEILLKEIHHRVKNNLQIVASMLHLQLGYIQDKGARILFEESQKRVESMSLIHEKLYRTKDLARIDFHDYVDSLVENLLRLNTGGTEKMEMKLDIEGVILDVNNAIPCGLIINELISNSLRHAYPDGRKGTIGIRMRSDYEGRVVFAVRDNGIGFPEDIDFRDTKSLGMQLVISLVNQLEGTIELDRSQGTSFMIAFRT